MPPRKQSKQLAEKSSSHATSPVQKRLTKAEQKRFKRFQKGAKKAGLLVSRSAYELYFRGHLAE